MRVSKTGDEHAGQLSRGGNGVDAEQPVTCEFVRSGPLLSGGCSASRLLPGGGPPHSSNQALRMPSMTSWSTASRGVNLQAGGEVRAGSGCRMPHSTLRAGLFGGQPAAPATCVAMPLLRPVS